MTPQNLPEILIADSQYLIVEGIRSCLTGNFKFSHVNNRSDLLDFLKEKIPQILLTDFNTIDFDGFEDFRIIKNNFPDLGIVILSNTLSRNDLQELNSMGISNILFKTVEPLELLDCLEAALKKKKYYCNDVLEILFESDSKKFPTEEVVRLTQSEIEIIRLITEGLTNKEIATRKFLSIHTIMTHRKNILRKTGVSNTSELIMYAIRSGLIDNIEYHI